MREERAKSFTCESEEGSRQYLMVFQVSPFLLSRQPSGFYGIVLGDREQDVREKALGAIPWDLPGVGYHNVADSKLCRVRALHQYRLPAVSASYPPIREDDPLVSRSEAVFDGDEELASAEDGELVPYAHRDIKPA